MEREIKFRAWDNLNNTMELDVQLLTEFSTMLWKGKYNIMQYTGLKDKNGKEIYEGDIVKYKFCGIYITAKIVFNQNVCSFQLSYKNINNHWITNTIYTSDDIEVIGNIYENPELLK